MSRQDPVYKDGILWLASKFGNQPLGVLQEIKSVHLLAYLFKRSTQQVAADIHHYIKHCV